MGANDAGGACELLIGRAAREFRCRQRPRIPRFHRISAQQKTLEVYDTTAARHGGVAAIVIVAEDGPDTAHAMAVEVDRAGRVVDVSGVGYG